MADWGDANDTPWMVEANGVTTSTREPYVHWFYRDGSVDRGGDDRAFDPDLASVFSAFRVFENSGTRDDSSSLFPPRVQRTIRGDFAPGTVAIAEERLNPDYDFESDTVQLPKAALSAEGLRADTVIVGIVDTGISLAHRNFRFPDGKTRFLAAWQQAAPFIPNGDPPQTLPFGHELLETDINAALEKHSHPEIGGWTDEDSFNRALGLVTPQDIFGNRELDFHAAHGTHVLSLAAGMSFKTATAEEMARQRIIAVNLPAQAAHGTAGNFLAYWAILAFERIILNADKVWEEWNKRDGTPDPTHKGFPIVVNFSYGMQAGPKDGRMAFEARLRDLVEARKERGYTSPLRIVMPAGNEAQYRGSAHVMLGDPEGTHHARCHYRKFDAFSLSFRLQPDDYTANYLEFFSEGNVPPRDHAPLADGQEGPAHIEKGVVDNMTLRVTPPGHPPLEVTGLKLWAYHDLTIEGRPVARLYCLPQSPETAVVEGEPGKERWVYPRTRFVLCTGPTASWAPDAITAPAGAWTIDIAYAQAPTLFHFYVQSDQSAIQHRKGSKRAYLDHPNYETHVRESAAAGDNTQAHIGPVGGQRPSYYYDAGAEGFGSGQDAEFWPAFGPVQRRGTHNALASIYVAETASERAARGDAAYAAPFFCIAGYEALHGRPALYSGVTDGATGTLFGQSREVLNASLPSEDAPHHFGQISAGAKDGSVAAFRGTSMSTAIATRMLLDGFMAAPGDVSVGSDAWFDAQGYKAVPDDPWGRPCHWGDVRKLVTGDSGRLAAPESLARLRQVHRLAGSMPPR